MYTTARFLAGRLALVALAVQMAAWTGAAGGGVPTGAQVLDRYVQVTGGKVAYERHRSSRMTGTVLVQPIGLSGTIELCDKAPNKHLMIVTLDGIGVQAQGYDGSVGWARDPFAGVRVLSGSELAETKRSATFNADLRWRDIWQSAEVTGQKNIGTRPAWVVKMTPRDPLTSVVTTYYDIETGLALRSETIVNTEQVKDLPVTTSLADYRLVQGLKVPFHIEQSLGTVSMKISIKTVEFDVDLPDGKFAKPQ
jgi:hypothetical protein